MATKRTTLYTADGRAYETADRVEITRLLAHGYSETDPTPSLAAKKAAATRKRNATTKKPDAAPEPGDTTPSPDADSAS